MKDTAYAFAVGSIRAKEGELFTREELNGLLTVKDERELHRRLSERGYDLSSPTCFRDRELAVWDFVKNVLPDEHAFDAILIRNDFHNLKVFLKAHIAEKDPTGLTKAPSLYDPEEIRARVLSRENDKLPEPLRHADRSGWRILTKTGFAQLADAVVDRAALEWGMKLARAYGDGTVIRYLETDVAATDIRVLWRCIGAHKEKSFMNRAVAETPALDKEAAMTAAEAGQSAFLDFLKHTPFSSLADFLPDRESAFESAADAFAAGALADGKASAFGVSPVLRYYFASLTEARNLRILSSGKKNGLPEDKIRERMRFGYV